MQNIYGSCVVLNNKGVLILGKSGLGKSDLCLRLIMEKQARLVADDRVEIMLDDNRLYAHFVPSLAGLLEVRGLGLQSFPFEERSSVDLVIELAEKPQDVERLPETAFFEYMGLKIPKINLYAMEASAVHKVVLALSRLAR